MNLPQVGRLLAVIATMSLGLTGASAQQQTRAALSQENNSSFYANGIGAITGPVLNSFNSNLLQSMGVLNDSNTWYGANTYQINPQFQGCVGYPVSTGTGPFTCSPVLPGTALPAFTGDVTTSAGSTATTITLGSVSPTKIAVGGASTNQKYFDVSFYGADPTGATFSDTGFQSAMNACSAASSFPAGATMRIPQGNWKLGTGFQWKPNCSIQADDKAHIYAGASINSLAYGVLGGANSLQNVSFVGGVWDCNGEVTAGINVQDFYNLNMHDFMMVGCNKGTFTSFGAAGASGENKLDMHDFHFFNYGSNTPTIVAATSGILFADATNGVANSSIHHGEIVGTDVGIYGKYYNGDISHVHVWTYASQGGATTCTHLLGGSATFLETNECDGPIKSYAYWFTGSGADYHLAHNQFFSNSNDNVAYFAQLDTGVVITSMDDRNIGVDTSHRTAGDFEGDLSNLSAINTTSINQVTSLHSVRMMTGYGSPNSAVVGNPGDVYMNAAGGAGATFWTKQSGAGTNTGWVDVN